MRRNSLGVVEFKHLVEQIESALIVNFANIGPRNFLFLHLVRDEAAVAVLKSNLFDSI